MANKLDNISIDDLPPSLRQYADDIGLSATLKLVEHYGGRIRVHVPYVIKPDHELAKNLGMAAARKLANKYGGGDIYNIPNCKRAVIAVRDREIVRRFENGDTAITLMKEYNITERMIWYILARARKNIINHNQTSIFDLTR